MIDIDQPMLARRQLRLAVMAALQTLCNSVESPGNWATPDDVLPVLRVTVPSESKVSLGRSTPEFTTSASVVIQGKVSGSTPEFAQDALDLLAYQVENAVLKDYSVNLMAQQFSSVETATEISSEGRQHLGGFRMTIVVEMVESFDPTASIPIASTWPLTAPATVPLTGANVHLDSTNVFDATGAYSNPIFPDAVIPAPRTSGPDGRDEGAIQIDLPQEASYLDDGFVLDSSNLA